MKSLVAVLKNENFELTGYVSTAGRQYLSIIWQSIEDLCINDCNKSDGKQNQNNEFHFADAVNGKHNSTNILQQSFFKRCCLLDFANRYERSVWVLSADIHGFDFMTAPRHQYLFILFRVRVMLTYFPRQIAESHLKMNN